MNLKLFAMLTKFIHLVKRNQSLFFLAGCIGLISLTSYNLGQINALEKTPIKVIEKGRPETGDNAQKADIFNAAQNKSRINNKPTIKLDTRVVVSKSSSSKKYHHTWCAGAAKIKPENQIWFESAKKAETAGYTLAGNCSL